MKKRLSTSALIISGILISALPIVFVATFLIIKIKRLAHDTYTNDFYLKNFGITLILFLSGLLLVLTGWKANKEILDTDQLKTKVWGILLLFLGLILILSVMVNFRITTYSVIAAESVVAFISICLIYFGVKKVLN